MPRKVRNYKDEYAKYQGKSEQVKNRGQRNAARAELTKAGRVHKGDGRDVDHAKPISKGGTNKPANLRVKSASSNRSYKRNSKGGVKG